MTRSLISRWTAGVALTVATTAAVVRAQQHIVNGQLMAVMIDDDPASSNNQSGMFGIEIEATTKVFVRNRWVRKIN